MAETVANIAECPLGNSMLTRISPAWSSSAKIPNAKVVGTNLSNYATPLLRYDAQDMVVVADQRCDCGLFR
jgi:hypothetical protein